MNPFSLHRGFSRFRSGRNLTNNVSLSKMKRQIHRRNTRNWVHKSVGRKDSYGFVQPKSRLKLGMLNVDGCTRDTFADVKDVLLRKKMDMCILLETKRRIEEDDDSLAIPGYDLTEVRRSDMAGDKGGGGICFYMRKADGLLFGDYDPDILDPDHAFVRNERVWKTVESLHGKTAVCAVYAGFQAPDDRNQYWNDSLYSVLRTEVADLRKRGFRVVLMGDFNGHVGNCPNGGIVGNNADVNRNGTRFLNFLLDCKCIHLNGVSDLVTGLWTRQRGGVSSILDYAAISMEHASSVLSMYIDDRGVYGGASDHNWIFLDLSDKFVKKGRVNKVLKKKQSWKISETQDWSGFKSTVDALVDANDMSVDSNTLAHQVSEMLIEAGHINIGLKKSCLSGRSMASLSLPRGVVDALQLRRHLESNWKTKMSSYSSLVPTMRTVALKDEVTEAEKLFLDQKLAVNNLFSVASTSERTGLLKRCQGGSASALKCFWSHLTKGVSQSSDITAVLSPVTGTLHCSPEAIITEVGNHLIKVFSGSFDSIPVLQAPCDHSYASGPVPATADPSSDHPYSASSSPRLPASDGSTSLQTDPHGWVNKKFTIKEVMKSIKKLKNGKARGVDGIPNEFLKNAGYKFWNLLTLLYNKVKESGTFPPGWNSGRVSLIHKKGMRELLANYRPLTVIISLSGLYSRILNERLTAVVETHSLLGEIQCGFRKTRMASDNAFVLSTVLWKARALRKKVHLAFCDISKAYDCVDRNILWKKLAGFGFGGQFLATLQAIYAGDSVQCVVNGVTTRPVYLGRGLRQGCSLSPMLFALYVADLGHDISLSSDGFSVGRVFVSGLFFADDLVLFSPTAEGLLRLLSLTKKHTDMLKMELNTGKDKTEVVSPDGQEGDLWHVLDDKHEPVLSLRQVIKYKYLGNPAMSSVYKMGIEKQKECIQKAHRYKGSCIFVSRDGPDTVDMILATWCNVAVPAILYGTEMVPFTETTILEIERTQSQVAKYALSLPLGTAGVCAQIDLGMKPFRQVLYEHQLKFYTRVLNLSEKRWVHQAMLDHLSSQWSSPYIGYLAKIRSSIGLYELPMASSTLLSFMNKYFLSQANSRLSSLSLPWLSPIKRFARQEYTREGMASATLASFRFDMVNIGHKYPRVGRICLTKLCPLCPCPIRNTGFHLAMFCPSIELIRKEQTTVASFRNTCLLQGFSEDHTFGLYINGLDWNENPVPVKDFLVRGEELKHLLDAWLSKW